MLLPLVACSLGAAALALTWHRSPETTGQTDVNLAFASTVAFASTDWRIEKPNAASICPVARVAVQMSNLVRCSVTHTPSLTNSRYALNLHSGTATMPSAEFFC